MSCTSFALSPERDLDNDELEMYRRRKDSNKQMSYRQLQYLAMIHGIPGNLKREVLYSVIEAKMQGREEEVDSLLKEVKEERLRRKRKRDKAKFTRYMLSLVNPDIKKEISTIAVGERESHLENAVQPENKEQSKVVQALHSFLNKKAPHNVTICQTQMKAQYRAHDRREISVGYASHSSLANYKSVNLNLSHSQVKSNHMICTPSALSNVHFAETYVTTSHGPGQSCNIPAQGQGLVPYQPALYPSIHNTLPTATARSCPSKVYQSLHIQSSSQAGASSLYSPDEGFDTKQQTSLLPSPIISDNFKQPYSNIFYNTVNHDHLVPFEDLPKMKESVLKLSTSHMPKPTLLIHNSSTDLECLANTAMSMSQQQEQEQKLCVFGRLPMGNLHQNYSGCESELVIGNSKSVQQDIPTWSNFLETVSSSTSMVMETCKYGCQTVIPTRRIGIAHEQHCLLQPFQCPLPNCTWVSQLGSLGTHIYTVHNLEVISNHEASFAVYWGMEEDNFNFSPGSDRNGPLRQTFLQLVDSRLFIIHAIVNFQSMQVIVYMQYLNDQSGFVPTAALEVCYGYNYPFQWTGRIHPLTYSSMQIITQHNCIIFDINENGPKKFTVHTKIRTHVC